MDHKFVPLHSCPLDPDPGHHRGGAGAGPAPDQEQVQDAVREGAEGPGYGAVPLQWLPGLCHRPEGPALHVLKL